MSIRKIKISNSLKRDAEINFGGIIRKSNIKYVLPDGSSTSTAKVLKSHHLNNYDALLKKYGSDEALATALIEEDPELDLKRTGLFVRRVQKMLVNEDKKPIYKVNIFEQVFNVDGTLKEEKAYVQRSQNINGEVPITWTGKQFPKEEVYNKFIFAKKYQLTHINGLTFDFLYNMAKELSDKNVMMLLGAGPKGSDPLVFQENGKPYRAFLEGRVENDSYLLLMHISNLELKPVI